MMLVFALLAQADKIVGKVDNPLAQSYGDVSSLGLFLSNILRVIFVSAGVYALFNFIIAGYQYMQAGGDSKQLAAAWSRIWQTLLGLSIIVSSFALAALFGYLFFGNASYILQPTLQGPN